MKNKELLLEISYKCNLNCIHCSSINCEGKIKVSELQYYLYDSENQKSLLDEIEVVRISGGEPSLLYDLSSYINFFKNEEIRVIVQTNAVEEIDKTSLRNLDELWISLYGNEYIHDFITGINDSYVKTNQNLLKYDNYLLEFNNKAKIVIQSPIFNEKQLISIMCQMNTGKWNIGFDKELRLFALLNHGRCNFSTQNQLKIYESLIYKYHNTNITCSLDPTKCDYENKLVLKPDGSLFNCASHKHGMTLCKK